MSIPAVGVTSKALLAMGEELKLTHSGFASGQKWGGIYHTAGSESTKVQAAMWSMFNSTNSLYPGTFPAIRKFEAEIIQMVSHMCKGGQKVGPFGLLSSGGTESIMLAALAYREQGAKMGITSPEIVCCETAHPAIHKACKVRERDSEMGDRRQATGDRRQATGEIGDRRQATGDRR